MYYNNQPDLPASFSSTPTASCTVQKHQALNNIDIYALPAEDVGVDRPCARAEQCKAYAEDRQQDMCRAAPRLRKSNQQLENGSNASHDRCPKATE